MCRYFMMIKLGEHQAIIIFIRIRPTPPHRRRRRRSGRHVPPPKKKIGKIFSGNYHIKFEHFRANIMLNSGILIIFHTYILGQNVSPLKKLTVCAPTPMLGFAENLRLWEVVWGYVQWVLSVVSRLHNKPVI